MPHVWLSWFRLQYNALFLIVRFAHRSCYTCMSEQTKITILMPSRGLNLVEAEEGHEVCLLSGTDHLKDAVSDSDVLCSQYAVMPVFICHT